MWANNLIADGDTIAAFLDPACSYGHAEVDLAYCAFVGTSGAFFEAYDRARGIDPGFRDGRLAVYRLLPELEHVRHFDTDGYRGSVDATLSTLGH